MFLQFSRIKEQLNHLRFVVDVEQQGHYTTKVEVAFIKKKAHKVKVESQ